MPRRPAARWTWPLAIAGGAGMLLLLGGRAFATDRRRDAPAPPPPPPIPQDPLPVAEVVDVVPEAPAPEKIDGDTMQHYRALDRKWIKRSISATRRWLQLALRLRLDVPLWLLLGHIAYEADGAANSNTHDEQCGGKPCDEYGLMQLMPAQSKQYGFQHARALGKTATDASAGEQSIRAGVAMYRDFARRLLAPRTYATDADKWRIAYAFFYLPAEARRVLAELPTGTPVTWSAFAAEVLRCVDEKRCSSGWRKHLVANEAMYRFGNHLAKG